MYNRFKELGIPVTLTRNSDETLDPTTRVQRILAPYGNNSDVIVISNHINAGGHTQPSHRLIYKGIKMAIFKRKKQICK